MSRKFSAEFKFEVVRQIENGTRRLAQVCREHDLDPAMVRAWRERVKKRGDQAFPRSVGDGNSEGQVASELAVAQARIGELERLLGQKTLEVEFLKGALKRANSLSSKGGS